MNAINGVVTAVFDVLLRPLEAFGPELAIIVVSGVFGILALIAFKHISWQKGIKATKDKIKGHMIEIRLYQDDLGLVSKAIGKVLFRNVQYLALNFGPFVPLAFPFVLVAAQMVVRYGFEPIPVEENPAALMAAQGTTVRIELARGHEREANDLTLELPEGVEPLSPLVRVPAKGYAFQEVAVARPGEYDLKIGIGGREHVKKLYAGAPEDAPRRMQGERVASFWAAMLWPSEDTFSRESGIALVKFTYPESDLGWLPLSGPLGVLVWFVIASMVFGFVMLKPLGVQI